MQRFDFIPIILPLILSGCASLPEAEKPVPRDPAAKIIAQIPQEIMPHEASIPRIPAIQEQQNSNMQNKPKKYPPLIYGAPKPLICSRPYLAEKKLQQRPNLQVMWENYLYEKPERVWAEVGGAVEYNGCLPEDQGGWRNACTVRLSHMLNKAGHKIPFIENQTVSGGNGDQYFFRLNDALSYIQQVFGQPDVYINMPVRYFDPPNAPGLFIMKFPGPNFTGHATIWNGAGTVDGTDIAGYEIFFWELPCFIPPDRKKK